MSFLVLGGLARRTGDGRRCRGDRDQLPGLRRAHERAGCRTSRAGGAGALSRPLVIAVDGPAASGKSTLARRLAAESRPGVPRYRPALPRRGAGDARPRPDPRRCRRGAGRRRGRWRRRTSSPAGCAARVSGQDASRVAAVPAVRAALLPFQRRFAGAAARCGAGRPRRRHRRLPRRHLQAVRHRQRRRAGTPPVRGVAGDVAMGLYTRRFWRSCTSVTAATRTERSRRCASRPMPGCSTRPASMRMPAFEAARAVIEAGVAAAGRAAVL